MRGTKGIVPDPHEPEFWALDSDGTLLGSVRFKRLDANGVPLAEKWHHAGWCKGVEFE